MRTSAVSFTGDEATRDALRLLATERKTTVGKLVADAIQKQYGAELTSITSFFRDRDCKNSQIVEEAVNA